MLIPGFLIAVAQRAGTFALSGIFLWQVALRACPQQESEVVIHVNEPGVVVKVDGRVYLIDPTPGAPIVCDLPAGNHLLTMSRQDRELYREAFVLGPGDSIVLTARDETRRPSPTRNQLPGGSMAGPCKR